MPVVITEENMKLSREEEDSELLCMAVSFLLWFMSFHPCSYVSPGSCIEPITVMIEYLLC